jgi:predicted methyltransferase
MNAVCFRQCSASLAVAIACFVLAACGGVRPAFAPVDYGPLVAASDRSDADRKTDLRRKPEQLLAFAGVRPGMKVLDMGTGGGYSTELLARAVGPTGVVYGQDAPDTIERAREAFDRRAQAPVMRNVARTLRAFDDPLPPQVGNLDVVTFFFAYHDTVHMGVDRAKMNRRLFEALKPGGLLVVADHSARAGDGLTVTKNLHRIEESALRREIEAAGFRFVGSADFLRNASDPRDVIVFRSPVQVDEFVLKFEKPR